MLIAEDWRFDGYRWKQIGKSHIPRKDPKLTKIHYQLKTANGLSKEFRKSVYKVHEKPEVLVVQYIGNADAAEDLPHGNAKKPINFLPVAKALTTQLEEKTSKLADICAETVHEQEQFQYDVAVYCICRGGGFSMERMISCDNCHSWYHIRCVGMTDEQFAVYATDRSKRYHCMNCMN